MKRLQVAIDSGAFSLYNQKFAHSPTGMESDRDLANYDYYKTPEFEAMLEDYIGYCLEHEAEVDFFVTMDIIYNAKASWEVQKYMDESGLIAMPVFHYGEPWEYLERYLEKYEYVGVGGLGQRASVQSYLDFGDQIFKRVCDSRGRPQNKMHGFAMTSIQLMKRYPWYSCDSSTWASLSRNGWARFPRMTKAGEYDWLRKPIAWRFTEGSRHAPVHIDKQSELSKMHMSKYLHDKFGLTIADVSTQGYYGRDVCNAGHAFQMGMALKEYYEDKWDFGEGANIYLAANPASGMSLGVVRQELTRAARVLPADEPVRYLGSYYYRNELDILLEAKQPSIRRELR